MSKVYSLKTWIRSFLWSFCSCYLRSLNLYDKMSFNSSLKSPLQAMLLTLCKCVYAHMWAEVCSDCQRTCVCLYMIHTHTHTCSLACTHARMHAHNPPPFSLSPPFISQFFPLNKIVLCLSSLRKLSVKPKTLSTVWCYCCICLLWSTKLFCVSVHWESCQ